jgi:hypothetical protein
VNRLFAALLIALSTATGAEKPDADAFTEAFKKAIVERDEKLLLTFADSPAMGESLKKLFENPNVFSVSLGPLPPDFIPFFIKNGKKLEPAYPPEGIVTISVRQEGGLTSDRLAYAIVDGAYKIVSTKVVDLDWKGPEDSSLAFSVEGFQAESVVVRAKFNASGVDVEQTYHEPSGAFWAQYISEVEVVSDNPQALIMLKIIRDGKVIFKSEPLKGAGKIIYPGDKPRAETTEQPLTPESSPTPPQKS